jgi:inorganic pyrophosphatase
MESNTTSEEKTNGIIINSSTTDSLSANLTNTGIILGSDYVSPNISNRIVWSPTEELVQCLQKTNTVDVIIEIEEKTATKYEFDKNTGRYRVDRVCKSPFVYPYAYGYIPNTLAEDSDELDIFIICDFHIIRGSIIKSRILGVIYMEDEKGVDHKIVVVPDDSVCKGWWSDYNTLNDLPKTYYDNLVYFLDHYKDNEEGKFTTMHGKGTPEEATEEIIKSVNMFTDDLNKKIEKDNICKCNQRFGGYST